METAGGLKSALLVFAAAGAESAAAGAGARTGTKRLKRCLFDDAAAVQLRGELLQLRHARGAVGGEARPRRLLGLVRLLALAVLVQQATQNTLASHPQNLQAKHVSIIVK